MKRLRICEVPTHGICDTYTTYEVQRQFGPFGLFGWWSIHPTMKVERARELVAMELSGSTTRVIEETV